MQPHVDDDVRRLQLFVDTAQHAVDELIQRDLDLLRQTRRILQAAVGQQLQHQFIQFANVCHQALQALASGRWQVIGECQRQAEIQACEGRAQFVRDGIEQVSLLVEQAFDVTGHGVKHVRQAADIGARRNIRALTQLPFAETFGGTLEALQITPVRAQPQ